MADGTASINIAIDYTETVHKVFGGWTLTQDGSDIIYPGDVVAWDVEDLYAKWIVPDLYAKKTVAMKSVSSGTGEVTDIVHPYVDVAKKNINGKNNYLSVDLTEYIIKSSETVTSESRSTAEYVDDVDGFFVKGNLIKTTYTVTSGPAGYS